MFYHGSMVGTKCSYLTRDASVFLGKIDNQVLLAEPNRGPLAEDSPTLESVRVKKGVFFSISFRR